MKKFAAGFALGAIVGAATLFVFLLYSDSVYVTFRR